MEYTAIHMLVDHVWLNDVSYGQFQFPFVYIMILYVIYRIYHN